MRMNRYLYPGFWLFFTLVTGAVLVSSGAYLYLSPKLPDVDALSEIKLQVPLRIYTNDGELIGEFGEKRRTPVFYADVPEKFIAALLAAEDDNFENHSGVDIKGLMRAASEILTSGRIQTGGSTITMQVARNFFLTSEQTFTRKFNEILLALQIERKLSKQQILELYMNKIYLGNRAYGINAAAQVYYGKKLHELDPAQLAMIAGLPKAPSRYNPIINPDRALIRRNWILRRMQWLGTLTSEELETAEQQPISASLHGQRLAMRAPYVAEMARAEMIERYGDAAYVDGYRVYTTIPIAQQQAARVAVIKGLETYGQRHGYYGPEKRIFYPDDLEATLAEWRKLFRTTKVLGGMHPAFVTAVNEQSIEILLADESRAVVEWDNGLRQARSFVTINNRGPKPETASEVAEVGDLVRVSQDEQQQWHLTQLPRAQAALVALDPNNGAIRALIGGFDYRQSKFNRVTQAARQPGSSFKPFVYSAALENGFTAASLINDAPVVFADDDLENIWRPENASGKFYGPTRLRKALYLSRNLVSIRILRSISPATAVNYVQRFGFDDGTIPKDLSLALGSHALTPLQIATGYAVFANGGYKVRPYLIERIDDSGGNTVYQADPAVVCKECEEDEDKDGPSAVAATDADEKEELIEKGLALVGSEAPDHSLQDDTEQKLHIAPRVLDKRVTYIMDNMLQDVIRRGTGVKARALKRNDIVGKTGTTNGPTDAWFSGYSPALVTTVWLGFDQNQLLGRREYGGSAALPIWIDFMSAALDGVPEQSRTTPEGIVTIRIDPQTGKRSSPDQTNAIFEVFREENVPQEEAKPDKLDPFSLESEDELMEDVF
ncbi:MAG: penicillin-binding protein 1A [Pseudomonadales bacterium]